MDFLPRALRFWTAFRAQATTIPRAPAPTRSGLRYSPRNSREQKWWSLPFLWARLQRLRMSQGPPIRQHPRFKKHQEIGSVLPSAAFASRKSPLRLYRLILFLWEQQPKWQNERKPRNTDDSRSLSVSSRPAWVTSAKWRRMLAGRWYFLEYEVQI